MINYFSITFMPLFFNKIVCDEIHLFVWKITETLNELKINYDLEADYLLLANEIVNEIKRVEFLVSRIAIKSACLENNIKFDSINKDEHGKPFLQNSDWQMSVSHTKDFVWVVLRKFKPLGIDIEKPQTKMFKVLNRLCSSTELELIGDKVGQASIIWSAKEALYKLYGKRKVDFKENLLIEKKENDYVGKIKMPDYEAEHSIYIEKLATYFIVIAY